MMKKDDEIVYRFQTLLDSKNLLEIFKAELIPDGHGEIIEEMKIKTSNMKMLRSHSLGNLRCIHLLGNAKTH